MDGRRFDNLTRALGAPENRRRFLKGLIGAGLAAVGLGRLASPGADAQVTQIYCGNQACASNPGGCKSGCVCCTYTNAVGQVTNSRCRPPGQCGPGTTVCPQGKFADPALGCVDCLSAANCPGPAAGNPCQTAVCSQGKCGLQAGNVGASCAQSTCASDAVTRYTCDAAGACSAAAPVPCAPYKCAGDGTGCRTSCAGDGDCADSAFCRSGQCVGDLELGLTCTQNNQCRSGFCTNGVCCQVASCGNCQTCGSLGTCVSAAEGSSCTPSDSCFAGVCGPGGSCFPIGAPRACEPRECNVGFCQNSVCQYTPVQGEPTCGEGGDCFAMACRGGSCQAVAINELQGCGGGTVCSPNYCRSGSCVPMPERANNTPCDGGICFGGSCCKGATEDGVCAPEFGTCCATEPCCGSGSCCVDCFFEPSTSGVEGSNICCPATSLCPPNTPNASGCCYDDQSCIQTAQGYGCIDPERICGGQVCDGDCCSGDCCEDGQYCNGTACVAVPGNECLSNTDCGTNLRCVGIIRTIVIEGGVPSEVITPGSCCPESQACQARTQGDPNGQPTDYCLPYGIRCGDPNSTRPTCDNAYFVACGGNCECSPRGGRNRL